MKSNLLCRRTASLMLPLLAPLAFFPGESRATVGEQVPGWEITSDGNVYDDSGAMLTDGGNAILIRKNRSTGITSASYFDSNGHPHPTFPGPINLALGTYPSLAITGTALIPLGGSPASFLLESTIQSGGLKRGFCRITFGAGLDTSYGALGFLETTLAGQGYLGQIGDRVYITFGAVDAHGVPAFAYGTLGRHDALPPNAQELDRYLQPSGAVLFLARKSSSAPTGYDRYLYRIMPDGHLDARFSDGILIGRDSEDGLYSFNFPKEANDQFSFLKFFTTGKVEKYSLDVTNATSEKVGEVTNLPTVSPWNTPPTFALQTLDGRIGLIVKADTAAVPKFVCINADFTSAVSTYLPAVYPSFPSPLMPRLLPERLVFPDFLLRRLVSGSGGNYNSSWLKFYGDDDSDGDGIADFAETGTGIFVSKSNTGTSPTVADSDGDGLSDLSEVTLHLSNPNSGDTDEDGFKDGFEVSTGFSPTSAASTPDALSSIRTAVEFRFNAADGVSYRIEASTDLESWGTIEAAIIGQSGVVTRFYSIENQPKRYFRVRRN